jgi:endonuclease-3
MNTKILLKKLIKEYGNPTTQLIHKNPFQLLIATILSAQCTDERVNKVVVPLFKKYRTPHDFANANLNELKKLIYSTGYYNEKAKRIKAASKMIVEKYNGKIPKTIGELIKLPGVGRKTANIVITYGLKGNEGIAVDTHVKRVSYRLGLTESKNPAVIERDLMKQFDKKDWPVVNSLLVWHGRRYCTAKKPKCKECPLNKICKKKGLQL